MSCGRHGGSRHARLATQWVRRSRCPWLRHAQTPDESVSQGEDQSPFWLDLRLARASTAADRLDHNDAVARVGESFIGFMKVLPGFAYISNRAPNPIAPWTLGVR